MIAYVPYINASRATIEGSMSNKHEQSDEWIRLYEGNQEPSFRDLVELKFHVPLILKPGETRVSNLL